MSMNTLLSLVVGGVAGTLARFALVGAVSRMFGSDFPYGTLVVNLTGCFLIGFLATLADEKFLIGPTASLLLVVGFCGAFTTFSSFILETIQLMRSGSILYAFLNIMVSVSAGFLFFYFGFLTAQRALAVFAPQVIK